MGYTSQLQHHHINTQTPRLVLGDQLNHQHSWYDEVNSNHLYVVMEMGQELIRLG